MNRFLGPAHLWLEGRTTRERRLLTVMLIIAAAVAVWLSIVSPALGWADRARQRLYTAQAEALTVQTALAQLAPPATGAASPPPAGLEPILTEAAARRGMEITTEMSPGGALAFRGSGLSTAQVFGWLSDIQAREAMRIVSLSVVKSGPSTLELEGAVAAAS